MRRAFTLIELIVVIGIIAVLMGITVFAVAALAKDSRGAAAVNTVQSVVTQARAHAMKLGRRAGVAFIPHVDGDEQHVQCILIEDTQGQDHFTLADGREVLASRFAPAKGQEPRELPKGWKIAGPMYAAGGATDEQWATQTHLPARPFEDADSIIAVVFGPDGALVSDYGMEPVGNGLVSTPFYVDLNANDAQDSTGQPFDQDDVDDEPFAIMAAFLSVFNDEDARERGDVVTWNDEATRTAELTLYIDEFADRLHFNRYTGLVMK